VEALVVLLLTVALAAGVVWWVTAGELPFFFAGRRSDGSAGAQTIAPNAEDPGGLSTDASTASSSDPAADVSAVPSAATRWPRPVLEPAPAPAPEREEKRRRGSPGRQRSSRSAFTYAQPVEDARPPLVLTILRLVLSIALVAGLIAGGIWALGQFVNSLIARLLGQ
jgi:hypothetical protein